MAWKYLPVIFIFLTSCKHSNSKIIGDSSFSVFNDTPIYFDMSFKDGPSTLGDSILRLDAGRVILRKVKLPDYELQPEVTLSMQLQSNGDPWDKSGSLFVLPKSSDLSLIDFENGTFNLSELNQEYPALIPFRKDSLSYLPNIELLRFMTPFGVGFFNDHEYTKDRKPLYIPHWEEEVSWSQDISHLLPMLEDEVYVGVFIDTWTKEGYKISLDLNFEESEIPNHVKKPLKVIPLLNTVKYASAQRMFDGFHERGLEVDFEITEPHKNAKLYYTVTGHGGHSEGDEFVKKENIISLDDKVLEQYIPWRDDCASFRRFNPSAGVWIQKVTVDGKEIDERVASSDFSRSNWCPGSKVDPKVIDLPDLSMGQHALKVEIPEAQAFKDQENNYWMVSAYLVYELDSI